MIGRPSNDDLEFHGSPTPNLGIELELAIIDRDSGDLAPGVPRILEACKEEKLANVSAELMQSMLEIRTGICDSATQAHAQLRDTCAKVHNITRSLGYEMAMWGTHPFARPTAHTISESERYAATEQRMAWMTSQRVTFGLHIHVGVKDGSEAVGVINMMVQYLPHLLALSANSPFWQGVDTGFFSARSMLYGLVPYTGVPVYFETWRDLREYVQTMRDGGVLKSHKDLKWDIRPRPDLGTIEFRVCDTPDRLWTVGAIAALVRVLVVSTQRLLEERPQARRGDVRRQWYASENKMLAARYGKGAMYIRSGGVRRTLKQELLDLYDRVSPLAAELGEKRWIDGLRAKIDGESGAELQRRLYRETGDWAALARDATQRLAAERTGAPAAPANKRG